MDCINVSPEDFIFGGESRKGHDRLRRNAQQEEQSSRARLRHQRRVKVNLHTGRIVDATVKALIERADGKGL